MATNTAHAESIGDYVSQFDGEWQRIVDREPIAKLRAFGRSTGESSRRGLRASADVAALVAARDKSRVVHCVTTELSTSGAVLNTHSFEPGSIVDLWIALPNAVLKLQARAVRHLGSTQAFEFLNVRDVERLNVAEYLDRARRWLT